MPRERPVVQAFSGDGLILAAILDVLGDMYDLLDARLQHPAGADRGPVRISEPAPDRPPAKAAPAAEPAADDPPEVAEPDPDLPDPPPRAGRGSSLAAWESWAATVNVAVPDGASRDDIINACQRAGVLDDS